MQRVISRASFRQSHLSFVPFNFHSLIFLSLRHAQNPDNFCRFTAYAPAASYTSVTTPLVVNPITSDRSFRVVVRGEGCTWRTDSIMNKGIEKAASSIPTLTNIFVRRHCLGLAKSRTLIAPLCFQHFCWMVAFQMG